MKQKKTTNGRLFTGCRYVSPEVNVGLTEADSLLCSSTEQMDRKDGDWGPFFEEENESNY